MGAEDNRKPFNIPTIQGKGFRIKYKGTRTAFLTKASSDSHRDFNARN
jgi:hypothetical protein